MTDNHIFWQCSNNQTKKDQSLQAILDIDSNVNITYKK